MPGHSGLYLAMKKLWENREAYNIGMTDFNYNSQHGFRFCHQNWQLENIEIMEAQCIWRACIVGVRFFYLTYMVNLTL